MLTKRSKNQRAIGLLMHSTTIQSTKSARVQNTPFPDVDFTDGSEFSECTTNAKRYIEGAFYPDKAEDIKQLVNWAKANSQSLWPISTGKNWGYGSSLPVTDHCYIVCLNKLTRIRDFNPLTGTITVEPGVTQQALCDYLKDTFYISPVTGAGPGTSILGNLLERGYGLAPIQDHFSSLLSLKAVLGNGETYQSPLSNIVGRPVDHAFKWGIGPYMDGLFGQSNFGIVTEVTIQLGRRQKNQHLVRLAISDDKLSSVIGEIQQLIQDYPSIVSGINLMNQERVSAMGVSHPPDWTGIFAINGHQKSIINSTFRDVKKRLKPYCQLLSINTAWLKYLEKLPLPKKQQTYVAQAKAMEGILSGKPTKMALNLTYLKTPVDEPKRTYNPAEDGCGLIWYAPLVPMEQDNINNYVNFVKTTCRQFNIEPLITLTTLNARCFDSTIPILFNKQSPVDSRNAKACFEALLTRGQHEGFYPYRLPISAMKTLIEKNPQHFRQVEYIKQALDPDDIIAPGRYCPTKM